MISTRIQAFDTKSIMSGLQTQTAQGRAALARKVLTEAQDTNRRALGVVPDHETFVDGSANARLESVRPNGNVVFQFELVSDVVVFCFNLLIENSPVLKGEYRKSHRIFADGAEVASPELAAGADEIIILPMVPYARKIERGAQWTPKAQKQKGVYQVVALMAQRRFGNYAKVSFGYREPLGGSNALQSWAGKNAGRAKGAVRQRRQMQKNLRQPAIIITFR